MGRPFRKNLNHRLLEKIRCYSVEEVAKIFDVNQATVLGWITKDLKTIDKQKPYMMFGSEIIGWVKKHKPSLKSKCDPRKSYCLKCRDKVIFDYQKAWIETGKKGFEFIQSRCPKCHSLINRFGTSYIHTFQQTQKGLIGSTLPPLQQASIKEKKHASIQSKQRAHQMSLF